MKVQSRPNDAWETSRKKGIYRRLTLRRSDGRVYLNRWGLGHDRVGGILLHRMDAPDPGIDLHDHPWFFVSLILWGGYTEARANVRLPEEQEWVNRWPGSIRTMRLDECHTITALARKHSWSVVINGPRRRIWGFYTPEGYMTESKYDGTVRAGRRNLWSDQRVSERPWK
jgi:hypothetical protein